MKEAEMSTHTVGLHTVLDMSKSNHLQNAAHASDQTVACASSVILLPNNLKLLVMRLCGSQRPASPLRLSRVCNSCSVRNALRKAGVGSPACRRHQRSWDKKSVTLKTTCSLWPRVLCSRCNWRVTMSAAERRSAETEAKVFGLALEGQVYPVFPFPIQLPYPQLQRLS